MAKQPKRKLVFWNIPVTPVLDQLVEKVVEMDAHVSKSDFVREAVREKLARMGLLEQVNQKEEEKNE
jgi:Arc/MetJ-type ribon-helix-helix transcriptional regulator